MSSQRSEPWSARHRLVTVVRRVIQMAMETVAPDPVLSTAAEELDRWCDRLASCAGQHTHPPVRTFHEHSPIHGPANPLAPPAYLMLGESGVEGTVLFSTPYEGGPGIVHGGLVAALFDDVLGVAQLAMDRPGPTGSLLVRYRRPTPVGQELHFTAQVDSVAGRRIYTSATLSHDGAVCAEAKAVFISPPVDITQAKGYSLIQFRRGESVCEGHLPSSVWVSLDTTVRGLLPRPSSN